MSRMAQFGEAKVADIRHLLVEEPTCVGPDEPIERLLEAMVADLRTRHVYVVDERNRLLGVVRMNRVVEFLFPYAACGEESRDGFVRAGALLDVLDARHVREIMNPSPSVAREDTPLAEVCRLLAQEQINELPVVDEQNRVVGQVNVYEVIRRYLDLSHARNKRRA